MLLENFETLLYKLQIDLMYSEGSKIYFRNTAIDYNTVEMLLLEVGDFHHDTCDTCDGNCT